ncbi:MAG: Uma2 family endonuclease [Anaerolineae bacterium]|nr:Uma2 family endonuclease [Anaerolineae bacterium]
MPHVPTWYSQIPYLISFRIHTFCRERSLACHISGAGGCYDIGGHVISPKLAYKRNPMSGDFPDAVPPEWAVEVISPNHLATVIRRKRQIYQQAGILLWEIYPQSQSIDAYAPGQPVKTVGIDGTLDGGDVLPGFTLTARDLFTD